MAAVKVQIAIGRALGFDDRHCRLENEDEPETCMSPVELGKRSLLG